MKCSISLICRRFLVPFCLMLALLSCKKAINNLIDNTGTFSNGKLSFTYNGKNHTIPYNEGEWSVRGAGLYINRPDIFNGKIYYRNSGNCTWFESLGANVTVVDYSNCKLTSGGFPIDSVAVYLYESGSLIKNYKNCQTVNASDFVGGTISYRYCDAEGTFNLVLKNKENKTIVITDGKFQQNSIAR